MFDHLLESSHRDDSNQWSNIGFGKEITQLELIEVYFMQLISGSAYNLFFQVGVTGFCMGGALSLASAALVPEISASAPFYGIPSPQLCDLTTITIPVQAHFGEKDALVGFSSKEDAEKLEKTMAGKKFELIMHPGVGHAFTNPTGPLGNYNKEESEKALNAMVKFMKENLA